MTRSYIALSAIIFALVALGHIMRIVQGWQVQIGETGVANVRVVGRDDS